MSSTRAVSEELLLRAAELRAGGAKWEAVAQALKRPVNTVKAWPRRHADRWRAALLAAERQALREAIAESVHVLRTQLRSKEEKTAHDAAMALTRLHVSQLKAEHAEEAGAAAAPASANPLLAFLNGKSDEQLLEFADAIHTDAEALRRVLGTLRPSEGADQPE